MTHDGAIAFLAKLEATIDERLATRTPDSYVASLVAAGDRRLAQKVGEEAIELALAAAAGERHEQIEEAADLVFHLLVLLRAKDLSLTDVAGLLEQRHRKKTR